MAAKQDGVVAAWQLYLLGWSREAIRRAVRLGWLHRVHHGVYAVGHPELTPRALHTAALLACGRGAVLSHRSAAMVWGLQQAAPTMPEVSVPRSRERRTGIRMHRPRRLDAQDVTEHHGFPVTTVTRTVVDMAATTSPQRLEAIWEAAARLGLLDPSRAAELCHGRRGGRHVRRLIAFALAPDGERSELELLFRRKCRQRGIPLPHLNVPVNGLTVDAIWPAARLVVELDSWEFHRTREAFERDRARDAALLAAGHRVMRLTWRQLRGSEAWDRLSQALHRP